MTADPARTTSRASALLPARSVELDAAPTAPGCARAWTRHITEEWQLHLFTDAAQLVVSELVTNAVLAARDLGRSLITLTLGCGPEGLVICVRDRCPGAPQLRFPEVEDDGGRGLVLVAALSAQYGWHAVGEGRRGKVVWAVLRTNCVAAGTRSTPAPLGAA